MSILNRHSPEPTPRRRYTCEHCAFFSYDAEYTFGHLMTAHLNRRVRSVAPHPGRREGDALSPWAQLRQAAAERGEGVSRPNRRHN